MSTSSFPTGPAARQPWYERTKWILLGGGVAVLLLVWMFGRSAFASYRLASAAVERFHAQLNRNDYETIYADAAAEFRSAGSRADGIKFFETLHGRLGDVRKSHIAGFHVYASTNKGTFVDVVYETEFSQGTAQESFIWRVRDGKTFLYRYHYNPTH